MVVDLCRHFHVLSLGQVIHLKIFKMENSIDFFSFLIYDGKMYALTLLFYFQKGKNENGL
jgi:hypothetical protein